MRRKQHGYTLVQLLAVIIWLAFWGTVIFVAAHFIVKFW